MELLQTLLITAVTLGILISVHEFGHFWVARRCGVRILRFSIGFGPSLLRWRDRQGTEYVLALLPLGGYVKMLDERDGEVDPAERQASFNARPVSQRVAIAAAGPAANFLLAIVTYWLLFLSGETGVAPIVDQVAAGSIAAQVGLEPGQEIVAVDGQPTPTWQALNMRLMHRIGESGPLSFEVRYRDSDLRYQSTAELEEWLVGAEAPDLIQALGLTLYRPPIEPVLDEIMAASPADHAGLRSGDRIVAVDGEPVADWQQWVELVQGRAEQRMVLTVERGGEVLTKVLVPARMENADGHVYGQAGVTPKLPEWPPELIREFSYGPLAAFSAAVGRTGEVSLFTLTSIKKMVQGLISSKNLSGPITIAKVASASARSGVESYLNFLALLSISLGVLNLLPIPVLDGGHILFGLVEWVRGRPVPERVQMLGYQLGLVMIVSVMILAIYNDLARL